MNAAKIIEFGYYSPRQLPSGEWLALAPFLFTTGLVRGIDSTGYRSRFCYPTAEDAQAAISEWDGTGNPPGPWIKEKGIGVERSNPLTFKGIPVVGA